MVEVNEDNIVIDNAWLWRADHGIKDGAGGANVFLKPFRICRNPLEGPTSYAPASRQLTETLRIASQPLSLCLFDHVFCIENLHDTIHILHEQTFPLWAQAREI